MALNVSAAASRPTARLRGLTSLVESDGLLILVFAAYTFGLAVIGLRGLQGDGWLAIVAGREVSHGLPGADHLTIIAAGSRWVDQQWLGQLAIHGVYRAGGASLVAVVTTLLATAAVVAGASWARLRGASTRATTWVTAAVLITYLLAASVQRTQSLTYILFVGLVALIADDSSRPSRRVLLVVPLLALWGNIHGSVVLAAGLAVAHALVIARRRPAAAAALAGGSALAVFASPYAVHLPAYYRETLLNRSFTLVGEWQPTTLSLTTASFFLVLVAAAYVAGMRSRALTTTEKIVLALTAAAALLALRNTVWFALAALMLVPRPLTQALTPTGTLPRLNKQCAMLGIAVALISVLALGVAGTRGTDAADATAVTKAAGAGDVFATERYADWILTVDPSLRGRVAYDDRFELLPPSFLQRLALLRATGDGWQQFASRYRVFVLDTRDDAPLISRLASADFTVSYRHGDLVVLKRLRSSR